MAPVGCTKIDTIEYTYRIKRIFHLIKMLKITKKPTI